MTPNNFESIKISFYKCGDELLYLL